MDRVGFEPTTSADKMNFFLSKGTDMKRKYKLFNSTIRFNLRTAPASFLLLLLTVCDAKTQ
jgi:hypothetical protein